MKNLKPFLTTILIYVGIFSGYSIVKAQISAKADTSSVDVEQVMPEIESRDALYSKYLLAGDSVAIAAMYARNGMMGCATGPKILASAGSWIRYGIKNDSRHVTFKTVTLNSDGGLLIETGTTEARNDKGELKYTSKYLVVWKKEDGTWKLYRDVPL